MARRCLRQRPRVSYYEPEEPNLDEYVFCEKCADYVYEYCAIHGPLLVIPDDKVPTNPCVPSFVPRAALTVPKVFLHLNRSIIPGAGIGVFASLTLPSGVRFGPYRGERTHQVKSDYCWQIYDKDRKPLHCVDAGDANKSNWMRYVNCARHWDEQNLIAYQYRGQLYYRTIKIISPFTELMVFYGSEFANELDVDLSRYNSPSGYAQKYGAPDNKRRRLNQQSTKTQNEQDTRKSERIDATIDVPTAKQDDATDSEKIHIETPIVTSAKQVITKLTSNHKNDKKINDTKTKKGLEEIIPINKDNSLEIAKGKTVNDNFKNVEPAKNVNHYYYCNECSKSYVTKIEMEKHMRFHDPNSSYVCKVCKFRYKTLHSLIGHERWHMKLNDSGVSDRFMESHTGVKSYNCEVCNKAFTQICDMKTHMRTHTGEKPYNCEVCNKAFTQIGNMKTHMRTHTGEKPYNCEVCNKAFTHDVSMKTHMRTHTGEKPYNCEVCNKAFTQIGTMKTHMRTHTGEKPYNCEVCNKAFTQIGTMKIHMRTHTGEKPYNCEVCNKAFTQIGTMKTHMRTHTGEKPYNCAVCNKAFTHDVSMKTHMRTHTGEKPYNCEVCNKAFTQIGTMKSHMRTHTGEKPYNCAVCNKAFTHDVSMKTHMRTHTGEKPYNCEVCNKAFTQIGTMKSHMRTHTGEKPYICEICDRRFSDNSSLKKHLIVHLKNP